MTLAALTGCSNPEEKRALEIEEAITLSNEGAHTEALLILEELAAAFPNDAEILEAKGRVYAKQSDHTMAWFFLEQAHLLNPEDVDLLYTTYLSMKAAGQPTGAILEKLLARSPQTMTKDLWTELGRHRADNNQNEAALDAYLSGVDPDQPRPETAAAIGKLFAKLGNYPQATNWLKIAADSDQPSALEALFSLLQIQLANKRWAEAEATVARLEKQFPGAVEVSEWQQASKELRRWRAAQEEMKAKMAAAEAARKKAEEAAEAEVVEVVDASTTVAESAAAATAPSTNGAGAADTGKTAVVAELEAAEAMANRPAEEAVPGESEVSNAVAFNPEIAIQPADPDFSINVAFDQAAAAPATSIRTETAAEEDRSPAPAISQNTQTVEIMTPIRQPETPKTLEELLTEAESAEIDRDYKRAIRKYWAAISISNNQGEVWNLLSRAYLADGQLQNADTTALEAVRLAPRQVAYTLDFLRVAQRSRPPEEFLQQLETAYDRFPSSPEITLSLARGQERIRKDRFLARNLYLRFVDIAPNHPLVPEARAAAERLR